MAPPGIEVIIGASTDPQFGHVLMFGLGGVLVELLRDVSFRVVPITPWDAEQMIREVKGYRLLKGSRGQPAVDLDALREALVGLSRLVEQHQEIAELDLNPIIAYPDGVVAVDARITLSPSAMPEEDR
jgi:acetyl-CoA synthetase (ADP-forming)